MSDIVDSMRAVVEYVRASRDADPGSRLSSLARELYNPDSAELSRAYEEFGRSRSYTRSSVGRDFHIRRQRALEDLMNVIYRGCDVFDRAKSLTTSVGQLDQHITLNGYAQMIPCFCDAFPSGFILSECKNCGRKVDVTWLGKFANLCVNIHPTKLGFLVSAEGLSGRGGWDDARGLQRIIYLRTGKAIISIAQPELARLAAGECFYDVVAEQIRSLHLLTASVYERYVKAAPDK